MNIIKDYPPNYEKVKAVLGEAQHGTFYCYGDTIYNPSGIDISEDLLFHESVHADQQKAIGVEAWWEKYLQDPKFRLDQEIKAYAAQYRHVARTVKDRNALARFLDKIAGILSSDMYGGIVTKNQAMEKMRLKIK